MSYPRSSVIRVILASALGIAVVFAPVAIVAALAGALAVRWLAWEVLVAGVLFDMLWLPEPVSFASFEVVPLATCAALVLILGLEPLRQRLLSNSSTP
jgi:hypothetical protein